MGTEATPADYDLLVVGGGINGAGIARDATGRDLSVCLIEMDDLASGTSSRSTKLIHGGLRYLEHWEFRLVREALIEREVLWRVAPHLVSPLRFVLPHHKDLRPAWLLRLGLLLYDNLGGRKLLPPTRRVDLRSDVVGGPLKRSAFSLGFEYSDCAVDDSRLVVLNARDAADRGATVRTRSKVVDAKRLDDRWELTVECQRSGTVSKITGRVLVNAAGPWVASVKERALANGVPSPIRLVQGSHIVVPKLYDHDRAYIFQNGDGRIVFAIPYAEDFTLVGTTDKDYAGDPAKVAAGADEIAYLCKAVGEYFEKAITPEDVVWHYSGIRPLYDDGAKEARAATRDYVLDMDRSGGAPLLSIFGGKITTYRRLAEEALSLLSPDLPVGRSWTAAEVLPGGDFAPGERAGVTAALMARYPFLEARYARVLVDRYGTQAATVLGAVTDAPGLGSWFGPELTALEVRHLVEREWARSADDVLWRRTKAGLRIGKADADRLDAFIEGLLR
jgi:glycerol-3-phosphate dehydrogenase